MTKAVIELMRLVKDRRWNVSVTIKLANQQNQMYVQISKLLGRCLPATCKRPV